MKGGAERRSAEKGRGSRSPKEVARGGHERRSGKDGKVAGGSVEGKDVLREVAPGGPERRSRNMS